MSEFSPMAETSNMELAPTRLSAYLLSRFACSPRAASLRLGLACGPCRGPPPALASVHPRCSRRLSAYLLDQAAVIGLNRWATPASSRPQFHTLTSKDAQ